MSRSDGEEEGDFERQETEGNLSERLEGRRSKRREDLVEVPGRVSMGDRWAQVSRSSQKIAGEWVSRENPASRRRGLTLGPPPGDGAC